MRMHESSWKRCVQFTEFRQAIFTSANRVAGGFSPPVPTTPRGGRGQPLKKDKIVLIQGLIII